MKISKLEDTLAGARVIDESSDYCGNGGKVERVYWHGEEPWVRIRSQLGTCCSVPWHHTDLPALTPHDTHLLPLLSPQALEDDRHQIPPADAFGQVGFIRRAPHIFTLEEIAAILKAAAQLTPAGSIRPATYTTLFVWNRPGTGLS